MPRRSRIQAEIRQRRPFASPAEEAVVALTRTADLLRRRLQSIVEGHGITAQQYNVLRILRGAGPAGLPTLDVGARMIEQAPGVTRLVDRLVAKDLVTRARGASDRRQVVCRITRAGLSVLRALDRPIQEGARAFMGPLGGRDLHAFLSALDALRAGPPPSRKGEDA